MLAKEQFTKLEDLALGTGELFRIEHYRMLCCYTLREFTQTHDSAAEKILTALKLSAKLEHPNLLHIVTFDYAYRAGVWHLRTLLPEVRHTLAEEIAQRKILKIPFSLTYIRNFLHSLVNTQAALQHNELEARDIHPFNIFIPFLSVTSAQENTEGGNLLLGEQCECLLLALGEQHAESKTFRAGALKYLSPLQLKAFLAKDQAKNFALREYAEGVFSLALIALELATLEEDIRGLNIKSETSVARLNELLVRVGRTHARELKHILRLMLDFDNQRRLTFEELDDCKEFSNFLAATEGGRQQYEVTLRSSLKAQSDVLRQDRVRCLRFFECSLPEKYQKPEISVFAQLFEYGNAKQHFANLAELSVLFTPLSPNATNSLMKSLASAPINASLRRLKLKATHSVGTQQIELFFAGEDIVNLKHLEFSLEKIDPNCVVRLCKAKCTARLASLDLSSNVLLGDEGVQTLCNNYPLPNRLKRLSLGGAKSGCKIKEPGFVALGEALKRLQFPVLQHLDLSYNKLENECAMFLISEKNFTALKRLDLTRTRIDLTTLRLTLQQRNILRNVLL